MMLPWRIKAWNRTREDVQQQRDTAGGLLTAGKFDEAIAAFKAIHKDWPSERVYFGEYCRALIEGDRNLELRKAAQDVDFAIFDPVRARRMHDLTTVERMIYAEICCDVCQTPEAIAQLSRAVTYLNEHEIEGDFVECGVYRGGSIVCMIRTLHHEPKYLPRDIWLYDTFNGMPRPSEIDRFYDPDDPQCFPDWDLIKRDGGSTWAWGPIETVRANVNRTGYAPARLHYVKGMVEDTIPQSAPWRIALLRLDTDFYASTKHELEHLYPRVVSGGVVIIDDYGAFEGCRKAVDEYLKANGIKVLLARVDEHVRMWVKP